MACKIFLWESSFWSGISGISPSVGLPTSFVRCGSQPEIDVQRLMSALASCGHNADSKPIVVICMWTAP